MMNVEKEISKTTTKIKPIDIVLVTFNRLDFLKTTVKAIYHRTRYPHRLIVVDNASTDGKTQAWLKHARINGFVSEHVFLEENKGLAAGFSAGFKLVKSDYFICTQDDLIPPDLKPCWLERMYELFKKYEDDYAGISMRIQRIRHREVDENRELIESPTSLASVFRIQKKNEVEAIGGFGKRPHWESTAFINRMAAIKKKFGVATHLYADHIGFMIHNKGFEKGFTDYHTYAEERVDQGDDQPYPDIDPISNVPIKINTERDRGEHNKRLEFWKLMGFKKSAVMLEALRTRHDERDRIRGIQMNDYVHFLYSLARDWRFEDRQELNIVEIGLGWGVSTNAFLYGLSDRHKGPKKRRLFSVDISDWRRRADVDRDVAHLWTFIQDDSTKTDRLRGIQIDILLIDGDHSYEAVKADYNNFAPQVRSGGVILLHDVSWEKKGVKKFYEELGKPGAVLPLSPSGMAVINV